jgi:hypothetical protein
MSAWGTAVFSDDTACDVRDTYIDLLGDGHSGHEATKKLVRQWSNSLTDPDVAPVFWLALAATQWKCGRLEQQILTHALDVIESGSDLVRWTIGSREYKKRQDTLERLRAQLKSPQPVERQIRKRFRDSNEWKIGDAVAYRLLSGRFVVLKVIGHHTDKGGTAPICEMIDWIGEELPAERTLRSLSIRQSNQAHRRTQFMIGRTKAKERPDDRIRYLRISLRPSQTPGQFTVTLWRRFDNFLAEVYEFT